MPAVPGKGCGGYRPGAGRKQGQPTKLFIIRAGETFVMGGYGLVTVTSMDRKRLTITTSTGTITLER